MGTVRSRNKKFSNFMECYRASEGSSDLVRFDNANRLYEDKYGEPGYLEIRIFEVARSMHIDDSSVWEGTANRNF